MTEGNARGASSMISLFRLVIYKIMLDNTHTDLVKTGSYKMYFYGANKSEL